MPSICSIQNSHVELTRKEYPHLKGIWFSGVLQCQSELEVDFLIGADYLWSFQNGETRRGKVGEPVFIETELGWVLSGPMRVRNEERVKSAQVMVVGQHIERESMESVVQKLWGFEGLGITESNKVHEEFLEGVNFTGNRYSVKLP